MNWPTNKIPHTSSKTNPIFRMQVSEFSANYAKIVNQKLINPSFSASDQSRSGFNRIFISEILIKWGNTISRPIKNRNESMSILFSLLKSAFGSKNKENTAEASATNSYAQGIDALPKIEKLLQETSRTPEVLIDGLTHLFPALEILRREISQNSGYFARLEIQKIHEALKSHPKRLEPFGYKAYSQNDEDGILEEIFKRIGVDKGTFCEIGVENGLECNSLYLIHKGWRGAWLEGNSNQKPAIESKFQTLLANKRLGLEINYITPQNINSVIQRAVSPLGINAGELDFFSTDIDGMDIYLLEALEYSPKVICIEYNAKFRPPLSKKQVFDPNFGWRGPSSDYSGASLTAINEVARAKGYSLVATNVTGINAFFVRNDLLKDHFDVDLTPENLYNPTRYYLWDHHFRHSVGHGADFGPYTDLV